MLTGVFRWEQKGIHTHVLCKRFENSAVLIIVTCAHTSLPYDHITQLATIGNEDIAYISRYIPKGYTDRSEECGVLYEQGIRISGEFGPKTPGAVKATLSVSLKYVRPSHPYVKSGRSVG